MNLSADDVGHADQLAAHGLPVAVIVPMDTPKHSQTPKAARFWFALHRQRTT